MLLRHPPHDVVAAGSSPPVGPGLGKLLSGDTISVAVFKGFLEEMVRYPVLQSFHFTSQADIAAAIEIVDEDGDGRISRKEFAEICVVLPYCSQFRDEQIRKRWCKDCRTDCCCPIWRRTAQHKQLRQMVAGWKFEQAINGECERRACPCAFGKVPHTSGCLSCTQIAVAIAVIIICNVATILAELQFEYSISEEDPPTTFTLQWWEILEMGFSFIYLLEMVLKIVILGPAAYFRCALPPCLCTFVGMRSCQC